MNLNKRQLEILKFLEQNSGSSNFDIKEHLDSVSKFTIVRDLNLLVDQKLIKRIGKGRSVVYERILENDFLRFFDVEQYFKIDPDKRNVKYLKFNFNVFNNLKEIFSREELSKLDKLNNQYQDNIKKLSKSSFKKEFERLIIELSWKSSQIEGNTYTLLDTEVLIKENREAKNHSKAEAIMILNHKDALEFIYDNLKRFKKLNLSDIEQVHKLIVKDLDVEKGLRKRPVGITGTSYKPLDNQYQIKEFLQKAIKEINKLENPISKALFIILFISYIQPFEDGNKRAGRMMANAILLANDSCPLSFRSIDEIEYKKAMLLFYEQNSAQYFKELFIEQFEFAVKNYFLA